MKIEPMTASHFDDAIDLFADSLSALREAVACLPETDMMVVRGMLAEMNARYPSAVAIDRGHLVGYLGGLQVEQFHGPQRGVFCPEWAHGATGPRRRDVVRALYAHMSRLWSGDGCANQAVAVLATDVDTRDALVWHGFGMRVVDAIRPVGSAPDRGAGGIAIRMLSPDTAEAMLPMALALADHVAAPPISVHIPHKQTAKDVRSWLIRAGRMVWLAEADGEPIGYVRAQLDVDDVAWIVRTPTNLAISGAYVRPDHRRSGVALALLTAALRWARERSLTTCSVDFESQNLEASCFWLTHFEPVCHSLLRRVDERTVCH